MSLPFCSVFDIEKGGRGVILSKEAFSEIKCYILIVLNSNVSRRFGDQMLLTYQSDALVPVNAGNANVVLKAHMVEYPKALWSLMPAHTLKCAQIVR